MVLTCSGYILHILTDTKSIKSYLIIYAPYWGMPKSRARSCSDIRDILSTYFYVFLFVISFSKIYEAIQTYYFTWCSCTRKSCDFAFSLRFSDFDHRCQIFKLDKEGRLDTIIVHKYE